MMLMTTLNERFFVFSKQNNNNNQCRKVILKVTRQKELVKIRIICFFTRAATKCSDLPPPKGGAKACDDWMFGTFCSPFCNNKSDFAQPLLSAMWVCGASGNWMPTNRFPDCTSE